MSRKAGEYCDRVGEGDQWMTLVGLKQHELRENCDVAARTAEVVRERGVSQEITVDDFSDQTHATAIASTSGFGCNQR